MRRYAFVGLGMALGILCVESARAVPVTGNVSDAAEVFRPLPENVIELGLGVASGPSSGSGSGEGGVLALAYRNDPAPDWSLGAALALKADDGKGTSFGYLSFLMNVRYAPLGHRKAFRPFLELGGGPYLHVTHAERVFGSDVKVGGDLGLRPAVGADVYVLRYLMVAASLGADWLPARGLDPDFRLGVGVAF
jgi:hypothetical protein